MIERLIVPCLWSCLLVTLQRFLWSSMRSRAVAMQITLSPWGHALARSHWAVNHSAATGVQCPSIPSLQSLTHTPSTTHSADTHPEPSAAPWWDKNRLIFNMYCTCVLFHCFITLLPVLVIYKFFTVTHTPQVFIVTDMTCHFVNCHQGVCRRSRPSASGEAEHTVFTHAFPSATASCWNLSHTRLLSRPHCLQHCSSFLTYSAETCGRNYFE